MKNNYRATLTRTDNSSSSSHLASVHSCFHTTDEPPSEALLQDQRRNTRSKAARPGRTSNLWLLTFLPFLFQTILGCGSPEAWHTKEATPPWTPVWSSGVRVNLGGAVRRAGVRGQRACERQLLHNSFYTTTNAITAALKET